MPKRIHRRTLLASGALAAAGLLLPRTRASGKESSPNERLDIAVIGCGNRGADNLAAVSSENVIALCDVAERQAAKAYASFPDAKKYRDFRKMLDDVAPKIDAVVVSTPDHTHAVAATAAMRLGKHCYLEKPLAHTVHEVRTLRTIARENKLVTQLGTQIHAESNYRRAVELVRSGAIGAVREVHVWLGIGYAGRDRPAERPPAWLIVRYEFQARGSLPPVRLTWYDGGKKPSLVAEGKVPDWNSAVLFVGEKGMLISDYGNRKLLPEDTFRDFRPPEPSIPDSVGHHQEWIQACKTGASTTCNFEYSGALTEAVLLGLVAYRSGTALDWDAEALRAKGCPEADRFIRTEPRPPWSL